MLTEHKYQIRPIEMNISFISFVFGSAILIMPRTLAAEVESADGWISILINCFLLLFVVILYTKLQRNYPGKTLTEYLQEGKVGKWAAYLFTSVAVLYFLVAMGVVARTLSDSISMYLLFLTPSEIIVAMLLLTSTYAVSKGVQGFVHLHLLFLPIIVAILLFIVIFNIGNMEFYHLLPILPEGITPALKGVLPSAFPFYGGVPLYFLLMSHMKKQDLRILPLSIPPFFISLFFIIITISSYAVLSVDITTQATFPTMELAKAIEIPGGFIERLEAFMLTIWIMTLFTTTLAHHFLSVILLKEVLFKNKKGTHLATIVCFFGIIIAFIPDNIAEVGELGQLAGKLAIAVTVLGIVLGYMALWRRASVKNTLEL